MSDSIPKAPLPDDPEGSGDGVPEPAGTELADSVASEVADAIDASSGQVDDPDVAVSSDADVERELRRISRRGFVTAAAAAAAGLAGYGWLRSRPSEGGIAWPFRRALGFNERVSEAYFSDARLSRRFPPSSIRPLRLNGNLGLDPSFDPSTWRLRVEGAAAGAPAEFSLDDLRRMPRSEVITELRCIEGWSVVVKWRGVRLRDLMASVPPPTRDGSRPDLERGGGRLVRYVSMETPDRGYYVGLDMQSALHPQTLLAYELNDQPLSDGHGAPLRLAIPVKYGIKNIKRVATIRYTDVRPSDFWAERGYDWYAGF